MPARYVNVTCGRDPGPCAGFCSKDYSARKVLEQLALMYDAVSLRSMRGSDALHTKSLRLAHPYYCHCPGMPPDRGSSRRLDRGGPARHGLLHRHPEGGVEDRCE